jgi:hypothetical protein
MGVHDFLETFAELPVMHWEECTAEDAETAAWWVTNEYAPERFAPTLDQLLERAGPDGPAALIVGDWGAAHQEPLPVEVLTSRAARLGGLRGLFIGEMTSEQCEISWIRQGDITPLLTAFPELEYLWVRGATGLELSPTRHENLRDLVLQSGGLPAAVVRAIGASDLPGLEGLELWLGAAQYGGDTRPDDLAPILSGTSLPALTWLGLCNAERADEIAAAVAVAPVVARLKVLDLSMGTLGDVGGAALLAGRSLDHLDRLDLSHHYLSPEVARRFVDELPTVTVDVSEEQTEEERGRYPAVAE